MQRELAREVRRNGRPPRDEPWLWQWSHRFDAEGATIRPGEEYQLVIEVGLIEPRPGRAQGVDVTYSDDHGKYVRQDPLEIRMGERRC